MASVQRDFIVDTLSISKRLVIPSIDTKDGTSTISILPSGIVGTTSQTLSLLPPKKTLVFSDGEKWIPVQPQYGGGGGGSAPIFDMNDGTTSTQNPGTNILNIVGDNTDSAAPFTQRRSGILTTSLNANTIQIQNQRDITSYVVGDPSVYNTQFATIQQAVDQAVADGVDSTATPRREVIIIVRPGEYPDDVTIPRHGIHIVNFTTGNTKDVLISGNFTFQTTDSPGKTQTYLQGLYFTGPLNIVTPVAFNPKLTFSRCLFEGGINVNPTLAAIELTLTECIVQTNPLTASGLDLSLNIENNTLLQDISIALANSFVLQSKVSTFNVRQSSLCSSIAIRARNSTGGIDLSVAGAVAYAAQQVELNLLNCEIDDCVAYGAFLPESIIDGCIVNSLTLGDPNYSNTDSFYQYCDIGGVPVEVIRPFIISGCNFKKTVTLTMKANIGSRPQTIAVYNCIFDVVGNTATPTLKLNDYSNTFHASSPQTFIIEGCNITGCISVNLDNAGSFIAANIGVNQFIRYMGNLLDMRNTLYPSAPYACIVGGSSNGITPIRVTSFQNLFTLTDITNFVFNGLGDGFIVISGQDVGGNPLGNYIMNFGSSAINIGTGTISIVQHGTSF